MYCKSKIPQIGAVFMIFLSWVIAFDRAEDDKTLNLKIGFDLTQGKNRAPSLRIRNLEELPSLHSKNIKEKNNKRLARAEYSSVSDDHTNDKIIPDTEVVRESDASDSADTSGSDDDRRVSTKGISPDEFEPERAPNVHGRYKGSDSE